MKLLILNHKYQYEILKLTQLFFPNEKIDMLYAPIETDEPTILTKVTEEKIFVSYIDADKIIEKSENRNAEKDEELVMASMLFDILTKVTGYTPKWGLLTGIRPSKLFRAKQEELGTETAKQMFQNEFFVSEEKTDLTASVALAEEKIVKTSKENSVSLYVSIPFCPTRCSYCSFVSHSMESKTAAKLVPDYVDLLCKELKRTGEIAKSLGLQLETVYFGGGTPTTLEAEDLTRLILAIENSFDVSTVREYTVEAGRPDTITAVKLKALLDGGVGRISINPQTFNDEVLRGIGRKHSADLTTEKFLLARELGFKNINMDLIAGLPNDTFESFCHSVDKCVSFTPENITVHTLALKRASNLGIESGKVQMEKGTLADKMLTYAYQTLTRNAYFPYYMYRQSKSLGNLENTGYCKENYECLYNIFMMEECHTVLAVGAGAVTKLRKPDGEIGRVFNFKYPYEYISQFDEILRRKNSIVPFFE